MSLYKGAKTRVRVDYKLFEDLLAKFGMHLDLYCEFCSCG